MSNLLIRIQGIEEQKYFNMVKKELFRKSIHLCSCFIPFFLTKYKPFIVISLSCVLLFYTICELLRIKGKDVFLISLITKIASRERDENKFVLGPVTLSLGILSTILIFNVPSATAGIFALGLGDGLASLFGKLFGRRAIPFTKGKTLMGSIACFCGIFGAILLQTKSCLSALILAIVGTLIELIPLKDFDNLIIPLLVAFVAQYLLHF